MQLSELDKKHKRIRSIQPIIDKIDENGQAKKKLEPSSIGLRKYKPFAVI